MRNIVVGLVTLGDTPRVAAGIFKQSCTVKI
jgi:hypothetical protein